MKSGSALPSCGTWKARLRGAVGARRTRHVQNQILDAQFHLILHEDMVLTAYEMQRVQGTAVDLLTHFWSMTVIHISCQNQVIFGAVPDASVRAEGVAWSVRQQSAHLSLYVPCSGLKRSPAFCPVSCISTKTSNSSQKTFQAKDSGRNWTGSSLLPLECTRAL